MSVVMIEQNTPRGLPVGTLKLLSAALAGFAATIPWGIKASVMVAFGLTVTDTMTGIWLAARERKIRSHTMRDMLAAKALQFIIIGSLGAGASLIIQEWHAFGGAIGIIVGIEAASNLENLTRLEHSGGAPLGPFRPMIWRLSKYFAVVEPPQTVRPGGQEETK